MKNLNLVEKKKKNEENLTKVAPRRFGVTLSETDRREEGQWVGLSKWNGEFQSNLSNWSKWTAFRGALSQIFLVDWTKTDFSVLP